MNLNPVWRQRIPLVSLLVGTAVIYLVGITRNGMANGFYAASVWAGSEDWKALLFGSLDPANSITVDKPPLSIWVMALSARVFGFSSASMLVPQALMAVAAVWLLYAAVRRLAAAHAGMIAGIVLALTPAAALMFRFNNPDAAMVLLMTAGAYCTVRALQGNGGRWLALAGIALGLAFLAKMLEGLLVLPALVLVYLVAAPVNWPRRVLHLTGAAAAMIVSAGWYVVLTILWPASSRPYLAGSTDNSFINLVFGYNGFGRVVGQNGRTGTTAHAEPMHESTAHTATSAAPRIGGFGQQPGIERLFTGEWGLEISFLLPASLVALVAVLWLQRRAPRTDLVRAGALLFGAWTLIDGILLAEMKQAAHPYYSLSMAPGIAGLLGIGLVVAWKRRAAAAGRGALAGQLAAGGGWSFVLLHRDPAANAWPEWIVLAATVVAVGAALIPVERNRTDEQRWRGRLVWTAATLALFTGPAVYVDAALTHPQTGGSPMVSANGGHSAHTGGAASSRSAARVDALLDAANTRWAAATNGSSAAASLELAAERPVIAVGGFTGRDPSPTLAQFQRDVRDGEVRYFVVGDQQSRGRDYAGESAHRGGSPAQASTGTDAGSIATWVEHGFAHRRIGQATVYDLTRPVGADH